MIINDIYNINNDYEYIILFCRIEYLSKMFGEYLRNAHFSLLVFIQCRQNKKIFGLCTIKFFFFMLVANRDRSTNRKSEWAELCCYRGRKTSARERMGTFGWEGNPFARQEGYTPSFSPMAFSFGRRVRTFFIFFFLKGRLFILYFPVFAARLKRVATCLENWMIDEGQSSFCVKLQTSAIELKTKQNKDKVQRPSFFRMYLRFEKTKKNNEWID